MPIKYTNRNNNSATISAGNSVLFNGSNYLSVPTSSVFTLGTNNHTIEFWIYQTSRGTYDVSWDYGSSTSFASNTYYLNVGSAGYYLLLGNGSGGWGVYISPSMPSMNTWHHIAIVRNGNTFTLYIDGVGSSATYAGSISAQSVTMKIGGLPGSNYCTGYISNVRVVNGTALYTSNFTPPTAPLTAIANTSLLTCNASTIVDSSPNNFTITNNGAATVSSTVPFTASFTPAPGGMKFKNRNSAGTTQIVPGAGNWTAVPISGSNAITYGSGSFVGVSSGKIAKSQDAVTWQSINLPNNLTGSSWNGIAYGNGIFVATSGTTRVMSSTDAVTWTERTPAVNLYWFDITYGNGKFIATGFGGSPLAMSSTDGITWATTNIPANVNWRGITYGNNLFVSVGNDVSAVGASGSVATSPDGVTWTRRIVPQTYLWNSVAYGSGSFVAVSQDGTGSNRVMTSPDAINWTMRNATEANTWLDVTYGNGSFVAVSSNGTNRVMTSPDGITWTAMSAAATSSWRSITYASGSFVAVGTNSSNTNGIMTAPAASVNIPSAPSLKMKKVNADPVTSIVTSGLVLNLDASNASSYAGSGTSWFDLSGNGNNGTLVNGPTFSSANGGSIVFDGSDDYVNADGSIIPVGTGDYYVESWINRATVTSNTSVSIVCGLDNNSFYFGFGRTYNGANGLRLAKSNVADAENCAFNFIANTWYHVAVGRTSSVVHFYINGQQQTTQGSGTGNFSFLSSTVARVGVGSSISPILEPINGNISSVKYYNRSLTASEVLQNYNVTRARFGL
jgi:hypothetical protein